MSRQVRNTSDLNSMSLTQLRRLADMYATKLLWMHSIGKHETDKDRYVQTAGELYHISQIIENKEAAKSNKKYKY